MSPFKDRPLSSLCLACFGFWWFRSFEWATRQGSRGGKVGKSQYGAPRLSRLFVCLPACLPVCLSVGLCGVCVCLFLLSYSFGVIFKAQRKPTSRPYKWNWGVFSMFPFLGKARSLEPLGLPPTSLLILCPHGQMSGTLPRLQGSESFEKTHQKPWGNGSGC